VHTKRKTSAKNTRDFLKFDFFGKRKKEKKRKEHSKMRIPSSQQMSNRTLGILKQLEGS